MNTKVARCKWVLVFLVSLVLFVPSSDGLVAGQHPATSSDAIDLQVYVYHPGVRRLSLITVGSEQRPDVAVDVDTNSTSPFKPMAAFMWLSPMLERHLNPVEVTNLLAALRQDGVVVPSQAPSTCTSDTCLTFLLKTLRQAVPGNPLAINALLDVLSDTLGRNPLEKIPEMVRWAGLLVGPGSRGSARPLSTSTLMAAYNEVEPLTATVSGFWAMLVACPAVQEHQSGVKARAEALSRCLGRDLVTTPANSETNASNSEVHLIHYLLAMLSAMFPS